MERLNNTAATIWMKLDVENAWLRPTLGEWCLWSQIIIGKRLYFGGMLLDRETIKLYCDNGSRITPDSTTYFAKVNKLDE